MARAARDSVESSRQAAEYSARSAAIAAAGTKVDFAISPLFSLTGPSGYEGDWFSGVRIECVGAAVYVHQVRIGEVWAPDPELVEIEPSLTTVEVFAENAIPKLVGIDAPMLMHQEEFALLEFPYDKWAESEVATLTLIIDYSFDGKQPLRSRRIEWIGQSGRDFGPYEDEPNN